MNVPRPLFGYLSLIVLALGLRLVYTLSLPPKLFSFDESDVDHIAWNLASREAYADEEGPTAWRPPSYVFFLAGIYKIGGHNYRLARLVQSLTGTILVFLIFLLARQLWPARAAVPWVAAWISACYPFFIYYDGALIAESFIVFWSVMSLWLFYRWQERPPSVSRAALCALAFAVLSLAKTIFIVLFLALMTPQIYRAWGGSERLARLRTLFFAGVLFALPLLFWGLRNQRVFGSFLLDAHGGYTALGDIVFYRETKEGRFGDVVNSHPWFQAGQKMNEVDRNKYYLSLTKRYMVDHPKQIAYQMLLNLKDFWRFYPRQDISFREGTRRLTLISLLTEPFLLIFGAVGLIRSREEGTRLYPIYGFILLLTGIHAVLMGQMRYRLPVMPFAILFTAYALTHSLE
jgi:4-amino-4-deoxy-L-arabinose transferase-like glycosyltransferase